MTQVDPTLSPSSAALRVVIAGPGAEAFAQALHSRGGLTIHAAPRLVEAIILARRHGPIDLFLWNVADERDGVAEALTALRSVHPAGRVVALCDPWDEPICRPLVGRGLDNYFILPCTQADIDAVLCAAPAARPVVSSLALQRPPNVLERSAPIAPWQGMGAPCADSGHAAPHMDIGLAGLTVDAPEDRRKRAEPDIQIDRHGADRVLVSAELHALHAATAAPSLGGAFDEETELERLIEAANWPDQRRPPPRFPARLAGAALGPALTLPVAAQGLMLDAVLSVEGGVAETALSILCSATAWPGRLEFTPADAPPGIPAGWHAVLEREGRSFGTLALDHPADAAWRTRFEQAAQWLTGWLALAQRQEQLRNLAVTDELSGAYNRRYFVQFVSRLIEKATDGRFRVTVMLFDIDDFKLYNDRYGHAAGDAIIRELIRLLRHCTRPHDVVARLGGDEFAVVFWDNEAPRQPNSEHPRSVLAATERFRVAVEKCDWNKVSNIAGNVSISGGIASFPWDAKNLDDLLAVADGALLRAKKQGKNVIVLHEPDGAAWRDARAA